jgi:hypothetical protein
LEADFAKPRSSNHAGARDPVEESSMDVHDASIRLAQLKQRLAMQVEQSQLSEAVTETTNTFAD